MHISAKITGINYKPFLQTNLSQIQLSNFDINSAPTSCLVSDGQKSFAISKWVSPKRTRSYPYVRVYETLTKGAKPITVIPVVKDEGANGDRDYLQWDTISLMSLLGVQVILAYYADAELNLRDPKKIKITNQLFDTQYVLSQIDEIGNYLSPAIHWNDKQVREKLEFLIKKARESYKSLSQKLGVKMHDERGLDRFLKRIQQSAVSFRDISRENAERAQKREIQARQPKEALTTATKTRITITNHLGGKYFFTADEIQISKGTMYLVESKHSEKELLPSSGDIKDGLLKMALYSNLQEVLLREKPIRHKPILKLTTRKMRGTISSETKPTQVEFFLQSNKFDEAQRVFIATLFQEAEENNFIVILDHGQVKKR